MKKIITVVLLSSIIAFCAFASQFHTVPLGDSSYKIIKYAELRGIIPSQSDVKPYTLNTVRNLLAQIQNSNQISETEKLEIGDALKAFDRKYGTDTDNSMSNFLKKGNVGYSGSFGTLNIGIRIDSDSRVGIDSDKDKKLSSRNLATGFIMGDIKDFLSYDFNASFVVDKLDSAAYNFNDYEFKSDGQYFLGSLLDVYDLNGEEGFGVGLSYASEITSSFLDDSLRILAGSYKRDWGPGINNLGLSGSAKKYDGIEIQYQPTSWFKFSSMVGSLGVTMFRTAYGRNLPTQRELFDNNFSIQRAEFTFDNFKVNFFESAVWKKRLELAYIIPVSIYWINQNFQGDWDSLLGGVDFSYRIPGFGRLFLGISADEFTVDLKHFFTDPRNILAIQGGFEMPISALNRGLLTVQGTYIPPFFGSHYLFTESESRPAWGKGEYSVEYANGGKGLSYPLNPDSMELLVNFSCSFKKGWSMDVTIKDQIQSAQYTNDSGFSKGNPLGNAGLSIMDSMDYDAYNAGLYSFKKFFSYIWKNTLDVDITVQKTFEDYPFVLSAGINAIADWTRNFSHADGKNYGDKITMEDWNSPYIRALMKFGFSVYY